MSNPIQNFYKSTITNDWSIGTGNFYVSVKPTTSVGRLVVSPSSDTLREIIEYTSTGTDSNGDYIVVSARGVGGTTEQTHTVGEKVRMNITAEDWEDMRDDIDSIVAAGAVNASVTERGIVEIATDAEVLAGTDTGETGAKLVATPGQIKTNYEKITPIVRTYLTAASPATWTKPAGLRYIEVEVVGGGGGGGKGSGSSSTDSGGSGGGAGGYAKKIISVDDLGESETITIGSGGAGQTRYDDSVTGGTTYFGSILSASGGHGAPGGYGGSGTGGDINIGGEGGALGTNYGGYGNGGLSFLGVLGAGGDGGSGSGNGGVGKNGIVIVKEFY